MICDNFSVRFVCCVKPRIASQIERKQKFSQFLFHFQLSSFGQKNELMTRYMLITFSAIEKYTHTNSKVLTGVLSMLNGPEIQEIKSLLSHYILGDAVSR